MDRAPEDGEDRRGGDHVGDHVADGDGWDLIPLGTAGAPGKADFMGESDQLIRHFDE